MPALYDGSGVNGTDGIVLKLPPSSATASALGSILSGITCAGAFAAFLSTFLPASSSMTRRLAHDVLRPHPSVPKAPRTSACCMFPFAAILIGVAILPGTPSKNFEINFMVGQAFAIAAASYFPTPHERLVARHDHPWRRHWYALGGLAVAAISLTSWTTFLTTQAARVQAPGCPEPCLVCSPQTLLPVHPWAAHPLCILGRTAGPLGVPPGHPPHDRGLPAYSPLRPSDIRQKMLVLHAPEALGLRQDYIRDHESAHWNCGSGTHPNQGSPKENRSSLALGAHSAATSRRAFQEPTHVRVIHSEEFLRA